MSNRKPAVRRPTPPYRQGFKPAYRSQSSRPVQAGLPVARWMPARFKLFAVVLLTLLASGHFVWAAHVSAQTAATKRAEQQQAAAQAHRLATFSAQMQTLLAAHPELSIGIAASSTTGPARLYGVTTAFDAASTGKLLTASDFLHHIETGDASISTVIGGQSAVQLLKMMIINSDDNAWTTLNGYLGHPDLQAYAKSIGISDYDADNNSLSAGDITKLLQQLYDHQLLSNANRSLLLSYMAQASYRDFALPAVPASDKVYHKVGIDGDNVHDALIITNGSSSFELAIFTDGNGTYNWDARKLLMQTITSDAVAAYL